MAECDFPPIPVDGKMFIVNCVEDNNYRLVVR